MSTIALKNKNTKVDEDLKEFYKIIATDPNTIFEEQFYKYESEII